MSIKKALGTIPSRPGVIIAIIVVLIVLSLYYLKQYNMCNRIDSLRTHFYSNIEQKQDHTLTLADIIPFEWDRVRIIVNFQNKGKVLDCPFDWDWTQQKRRQLMEQNRLSVLAFAKGGTNIIVDFDAERIAFAVSDKVFTPASATFHIHKTSVDKTQYTLSQIK